MRRNKIRIAIQKEGRLKSGSLKFLESLGLRFSKENERTFIVPCQNFPVEILFVRHGDIPQYVQYGAADFGIIGENLLFENDFKVSPVEQLRPSRLRRDNFAEGESKLSYGVKIIKKLGFGKCALVLAVPINSGIEKISQLEGERIASSYSNSLRKFLKKQKLNASIIEIKGAVEITPALELADAICDLTQTGRTLRENNLRPIATLLKSEAVLIESVTERERKFEFKKILRKSKI